MELDFRTIRALSSRDRIAILRSLLETACTPAELGRRVDADTDAVVMQLETLQGADLVEQRREGDMQVVYAPTEKARAVVAGGTQKVRFALSAGTVFAAVALAILTVPTAVPGLGMDGPGVDRSAMQSPESTLDGEPTEHREPATRGIRPVHAVGAAILAVAALAALWYGWTLRRLTPDAREKRAAGGQGRPR